MGPMGCPSAITLIILKAIFAVSKFGIIRRFACPFSVDPGKVFKRIISLRAEQEESEPLYGVSQDTIRALEEALEEEDKKQVKKLIKPLHAADVAVVIEYLSPHLRYHCIETAKSQ